jgi:hypothetical protein
MDLVGGGGVSEPTTTPGTGRRQVVAVLRLVVSASGELQFGEAIDVETEKGRRFTRWSGLTATVRSVVADAVDRTNGSEPRSPSRRSGGGDVMLRSGDMKARAHRPSRARLRASRDP